MVETLLSIEDKPNPIYESQRQVLDYVRQADPTKITVYKAIRRGEIIHSDSYELRESMDDNERFDLEETISLPWMREEQLAEEFAI